MDIWHKKLFEKLYELTYMRRAATQEQVFSYLQELFELLKNADILKEPKEDQ